MNSNTVFNFNMGYGVSADPNVCSYEEVKQQTQTTQGQRGVKNPSFVKQCVQRQAVGKQRTDFQASENMNDVSFCDKEKPAESMSSMQPKVQVREDGAYISGYQDVLRGSEKQPSVQEEDIPLIQRVFDRDTAKNFTEYALSRPTTFAHKCEEVMMGTCVAAILSGAGAAISVASPEYIQSNEKVALGFLCAMGICMTGTVLSGVVGGISEYIDERKKRMIQERNQHMRD